MRVVVIGGTGFAGARIVERLRAAGHDAVAASPGNGVDTRTGAGLAAALEGAAVVVDASNAPPTEDPTAFFEASTRNLVAACAHARVGHLVVLSIVGVDRLGDTPYFRGKNTQERMARESGIPFSIVRATQFVEFIGAIADGATVGDDVRLPPILIQPIPVDDAAAAVARVALGAPANAVVNVAGPTRYRLDELVAQRLAATNDRRRVIADAAASYFGARVTETSLVPPG